MGGEAVSADPTRPAARATLPVKGRDLSPAIAARVEKRLRLHVCRIGKRVDAAQSLPFTGRVAREARRVGF